MCKLGWLIAAELSTMGVYGSEIRDSPHQRTFSQTVRKRDCQMPSSKVNVKTRRGEVSGTFRRRRC